MRIAAAATFGVAAATPSSMATWMKACTSHYMGRFTLPELLGVATGVLVLLVVLTALFMFWGAEQLERIFGGKDPKHAPKLRYAGAAILGVAASGPGFQAPGLRPGPPCI